LIQIDCLKANQYHFTYGFVVFPATGEKIFDFFEIFALSQQSKRKTNGIKRLFCA